MKPANRIARCTSTKAEIRTRDPALLRIEISLADAGIRGDQQQVSEEIPRDHKNGREHGRSNYYIEVSRNGCIENEWSQPRPACDHFNQQRGTEQAGEKK